jgi:hypothetical protein
VPGYRETCRGSRPGVQRLIIGKGRVTESVLSTRLVKAEWPLKLMYYAACIFTPCYQRDGCRYPSDPCAGVHKDSRGILFLVPRPKTPMYAQIVMTFVTKKQQQEYHACSSRIVREPDMKPTYHKQMTFTCPTEDHRRAQASSTKRLACLH